MPTKSEIFRKLAEERGIPVINVKAVQNHDPIDFIGIPEFCQEHFGVIDTSNVLSQEQVALFCDEVKALGGKVIYTQKKLDEIESQGGFEEEE
jgi:hypothetical protein